MKPSEIPGPVAVDLLLTRESQEKRLTLDAPGKATFQLAAGTTWRISAAAEDYWAPEQVVEVEAEGVDVSIDLVPSGIVAVGLASEGSPLPDRLSMRISSAVEKSTHWVETCEVSSGSARCRAPTGPFDLRFAAEGHVPHYFWSIDVPWKAVRRLGTLKLRKGASLVSWIDPPDRDFGFDQVELSLVPRTASTLDSRAKRRLSDFQRSASVDEQGFFQVAGIRPGAYDLVAEHPDFVATRLEVVVSEGEELELEPLSLSQGAILDLQVRQVTDPFRQPWHVTLAYRGSEAGYLEQVAVKLPADPDGRLRLPGLPAGHYQLAIEDSRDGRWHVEWLELFDGVNVHETRIHVERLEVTLLRGEEPLSGALVEIREHQGNSRQTFTSRQEGKVYAFLRADRLWSFEITHEELGVAASFLKVEVPEIEEGEPHAKKELMIPSTRVFGTIVDALGAPVDELVDVELSVHEVGTLQRFVRGGRFDFSGLAEGSLGLQASRYDSQGRTTAQSARLTVVLEQDVGSGPVTLQLVDTHTLGGLVVSPNGDGVPGAQVVALLEHAGTTGLTAGVPTATTDLEGVFELNLPGTAEVVQLTVYPPGFAATQERIRLDQDHSAPVIIPVDSVGGTVVVRYENASSRWLEVPVQLTLNTALYSPNAHVPLYLMRWAERSQPRATAGFEWALPMIAPGPVRVCFGREFRALLETAAAVPESLADRCFEGSLPPHGELILEISEEVLDLEARSSS